MTPDVRVTPWGHDACPCEAGRAILVGLGAAARVGPEGLTLETAGLVWFRLPCPGPDALAC